MESVFQGEKEESQTFKAFFCSLTGGEHNVHFHQNQKKDNLFQINGDLDLCITEPNIFSGASDQLTWFSPAVWGEYRVVSVSEEAEISACPLVQDGAETRAPPELHLFQILHP